MDIKSLIGFASIFFGIYVSVFFILLYFKYKKELFEENKLKETNWRPRVSVIIPAYNEGPYIKKCIETTLASNYPKDKFEVIVIDDGSKDDTYAQASSIKDSRLKVFTKPNSGKAASLNFGIEKATGEFIATMDADSYVMPDTIIKMLRLFDKDDVAVVTAAVRVRPSSKWLQEIQRIEYLTIVLGRRLLSFIEAVPVTPGPFSMFRKWVFEKLGGFDTNSIVEDHEMALRIQSHHYKLRSSMEAEVYTETPNSVTDLIKQRVRWHRGGVHNTINYRHMISPKYGDFGVFVLPIIFVSISVFLTVIYTMVDSILAPKPIYAIAGLDMLVLAINPFVVTIFFLALLSFFWTYKCIKTFKNESANPVMIFIFLAFYAYLALAYNLITIAKELKRERLSW